MNDTTKWIMIILLLLLIGAAVFMLLRSPGKENGAVDAARDTDRDGMPTADREVYDQEAELSRGTDPVTGEPVVQESATREYAASDEPVATEPVVAEPVVEEPVVEEPVVEETTDAPYAEEDPVTADSAYAEDSATADTTYADDTATADTTYAPAGEGSATGPTAEEVRPLTTEEIDAGGRDEPLEVSGQELAAPVEDSSTPVETDAAPGARTSGWDADGPDVGRAAAFGAAAAAGGAAAASTTEDDEHPVGDESTTYRAEDGVAVPVEEPAAEPVADETVVTEPFVTEPVADQPVVTEPAAEDTLTDSQPSSGLEHAAERGAGYETVETAPADARYEPMAPVDEGSPAPADTGYGAPETADDIATGATTTDTGEHAAGTDTGEYAADTGSDVTGTDTVAAGADTAEAGADTTDAGYAPVYAEAAYGPGSAEPLEDGSGPAGWEIKGNAGSMLFHTSESPSYDAVRAEVWFESEEAARAAGFAHWDRRRR